MKNTSDDKRLTSSPIAATERHQGQQQYNPLKPSLKLPEPSVASRAVSLTNRTGIPKGSLRGAGVCSRGKPRIMWYESKLELNAQLLFQTRPNVETIHEQQPRIEYVDPKGRQRSHTFDLLAFLSCGKRIAVAIKPFERTRKERLRDQLHWIASFIPPDVADSVLLLTEREMPRHAVTNAELIHAAQLDPDPDADAALLAVLPVNREISVGELVTRAGHQGRSYRAVARLLGNGTLRLAQPGLITYQAMLIPSVKGEMA